MLKQLNLILILTKIATIEMMLLLALWMAYLLPSSTRGPVYLFEMYFIVVLIATKQDLYSDMVETPITKWWALS